MKKEKVLSTEAQILKISYDDSNGNSQHFFVVEIKVQNETINLMPKDQDKKLFYHLLKNT